MELMVLVLVHGKEVSMFSLSRTVSTLRLIFDFSRMLVVLLR